MVTGKTSLLFLLASLGVGVLATSRSTEAMSISGASSLKFAAGGPAGLSIEGDGGTISFEENAEKVQLKTSMTSLRTGIELRDEHLKKYIDASAHPVAILTIEKTKIPHPEDGRGVEGTMQAELTFHGKTKVVPVVYKVEKSGRILKVQGRFEFDLPDHGVTPPCYLGVCVDKHVKVKAKLSLSEN